MDTVTIVTLMVLSGCVLVNSQDDPINTFPSDSAGNSFRNLVPFNDSVFIGTKDKLFNVRKSDLSKISDASTCIPAGSSCNNENQVLAISDKGDLLICGTGNAGRCRKSLASEFPDVQADPIDASFTVSNSTARPVVAFYTPGSSNVYFGITFGDGITASVNNFFPVSLYAAEENPPETKRIRFDANTVPDLHQYLMYFKAGFSNEGYSYFLTNQRYSVGNNTYVSKLTQLCQRDIDTDHADLFSYTDIVITCGDYDLLQDAVVINTGDDLRQIFGDNRAVIATFSKGTHPESPTSESAVCVFPMKMIEEAVLDARKDAIICPTYRPEGQTCNTDDFRLPDSERYFKNNIDPAQRIDASDYESFKEEIRCNVDISAWYSIIGELPPLHADPVYTSSDQLFTKVQGIRTYDKYTTLYVGTKSGQVVKLNLNNGTNATVYGTVSVDLGRPIQAIYVDEEFENFMSDRKLAQYKRDRCDSYKSCSKMMEVEDPNCGWCVYSKNATKKGHCSNQTNHWLSSLEHCVALTPNPAGIPIDEAQTVSITVAPLPEAQVGDSYSCVFHVGNGVKRTVLASKSGEVFRCEARSVSEHVVGHVELLVNNNGNAIPLASAEFRFYDCTKYKNCSDCTGTPGTACYWSLSTTDCRKTSLTTSGITMESNCPSLSDNSGNLLIHDGTSTEIELLGENLNSLQNDPPPHCYFLDDTEMKFPATVDGSAIKCNVTRTLNETTKESVAPIGVLYGSATLDDRFGNAVTVYSCERKGVDCSTCRSFHFINSLYNCGWCSGTCVYNQTCSDSCPLPTITEVSPNTGPTHGGTTVTITGTELGSRIEDVYSVTLAGETCETKDLKDQFQVSKRIVCKSGKSNATGPVTVAVKGQTATDKEFRYLKPVAKRISPTIGPAAGGTKITIYGENLGIGNQIYRLLPLTDKGVQKLCDRSEAVEVSDSVSEADKYAVTCYTAGANEEDTFKKLLYFIDGGIDIYEDVLTVTFNYTADPNGVTVNPKKSISSGGTALTVCGNNLQHIHSSKVISRQGGVNVTTPCTRKSDSCLNCAFPKLTPEMKKRISGSRQRRSSDSVPVSIEVVIKLDGYETSFTIEYFRDPQVDEFEGRISVYETDQEELVIKGSYLALVAKESDYSVTVGTEECTVVVLENSTLKCRAPKQEPTPGIPGAQYPEVNVTVGNYRVMIGVLQYQKQVVELQRIMIIVGSVLGCVVALVVVGVIIGCIKYRRIGKKAREFQDHLKAVEMEIRHVVREEFADMQNSMAVVNTNLVERGFPYHSYQQYSFNVLFPSDFIDNHPLLHEPVVSDDVRLKLKDAMMVFEDLIGNKFFMLSVISTMERQRKFLLRDKSNMAGYLSTILLGKMDYFNEILRSLLSTLVQDSIAKKSQKTLFRRCESVTEKLLNNWLSLCLYPHTKSYTGSPLYLLSKATQIHIESGPVDAVTMEAKYTLSEEKLLKNYNQQVREGSNDPTFEAKLLTLNVVINSGDECFGCKVLDCDTISQVKMKCLSQIYVNYPASELSVNPSELDLEWHSGFSGCLKLRDEDNTSKREGGWIRLNTLAHYSVKDDSNMALVDPLAAGHQSEDYVNLAQIQLENNANCNGSMDSTNAMINLVDEENPQELNRWHMVKQDDENQKKHNAALDELYLNRLLGMKLAILDYIKALFDAILNKDRVPPPVRFLYNFLDDLAAQNKVESDVVHAWKSHSYPIRIWAGFITKPNKVFDVSVPPYVDTSLEVISQAFIDSFATTSQKLSKDSPSHKLLFTQENAIYREHVQSFYKAIKPESQSADELRQYLNELNRLQMQETQYNKTSALFKLYEQLQPYFTDIIQDLEDGEWRSLQLDKRLEEIIRMME